jgi:hypothetical protein
MPRNQTLAQVGYPRAFAEFAATFPGCVCRSYDSQGRWDRISASIFGSADDLIRHGFISASQIEALPQCGVKHFGRERRCGFYVTIYRRPVGYRVAFYMNGQQNKVAAALRKIFFFHQHAQPPRGRPQTASRGRHHAIGRNAGGLAGRFTFDSLTRRNLLWKQLYLSKPRPASPARWQLLSTASSAGWKHPDLRKSRLLP